MREDLVGSAWLSVNQFSFTLRQQGTLHCWLVTNMLLGCQFLILVPGAILEIGLRVGAIPLNITPRHVLLAIFLS